MLLGDDAFLEEKFEALEIGFGILALGLIFGELALRLLELDLKRAWIDQREEVTFMNVLPLSESHAEKLAVDAATDKIARQMRKYKTRLMRKHRPRKDIVQHLEEHVLHPEPIEEDEHHEHAVVSTERLAVKPMFVDEAVLQLEMSHRQFLVFLNARSARVNVLYRRRSGDFGLIEPTAN